MTTKIPVELSSTPGIVDGSNATAITISSAEKVTFAKDIEIQGDSVSGSEGGHITLRAASGGSKEFGIDVDSSNNLRFITEDDGTGDNGAAHVYLTNTGDIGIGTAPSFRLHVTDSSGGTVAAFSDTTSADLLMVLSGGVSMLTPSTGILALGTSSTERMRISSGVVGIGITTPADNNTKCLYLKGDENVMSIRNLSTTNAGERVSIDFLDHNGTRRGYVSVDTSGTLFSTSSDYRLKNVIEPVQNGIERINKLKPVKFEWKETGKEEEGFIAHEVDEIFKDAVGGEKDAVKEDGSIDAQTMDYGRITPLLVKAIQEQQEQIEQLKAEIQTLKGE